MNRYTKGCVGTGRSQEGIPTESRSVRQPTRRAVSNGERCRRDGDPFVKDPVHPRID